MPPKGSAKKRTPKSSPAVEHKTTPGSKSNLKASSKTIAKPKDPPSSTPETDPKPSPTPPATNTSSESKREPAPKAEVDDAAAAPKVEPDVQTAAREPEIPVETAAPQTEATDKAGESQKLESEVQGVDVTTSARAESGEKPAPKTKKKIIRRVIVRTRKVPVQKKVPAGENPSPASTISVNRVSLSADLKNPSSSSDQLPKPSKEDDVKPFQAAPVKPAEKRKPVEANEGPKPATVDKAAHATDAGRKPLSGEEMGVDLWVDEFEVAERRKKRRTEIFVGGLDKEAKEEDIRKVFEKVGKIVEVRLMKNSQTGKNKGYAFLRYAKPTEAQRAIHELARAEVGGKPCAAAPLQDNDTIFLGSIDKRWKKEDVIRILQEIGIENIHTVYVMMDPNNPGHNRGFAFLELETNKDAQNAYKKLQKKDVFGKGQNIKVAWAEPLNDPGEEEMQKVKSVYANGVPASWDEEKVKKYFSKFGEIERIKLAKDMHNPKRKDFAFVNYATREAALACIESFNKDELVDEGSKVNIKVMLAKPVQKSNQNKGRTKVPDVEQPKERIKQQLKERIKEVHDRPKESIIPSKKGRFIGKDGPPPSIEKKSSDTEELIQVLREQAALRRGTSGFARVSAIEDYSHGLAGGKRPFSALGEDPYSEPRGYSRVRDSEPRGYSRVRDSSFPHTSTSYSSFSYDGAGTSIPYYQHHSAGYAGSAYTSGSDYSTSGKMRYGTYSYGGGPSLGY